MRKPVGDNRILLSATSAGFTQRTVRISAVHDRFLKIRVA